MKSSIASTSSLSSGPVVAVIEPVAAHGGMHWYDYGLCASAAKQQWTPVLYTSGERLDTQGWPFSAVFAFDGTYGSAPKPVRAWRYLRGLWRTLGDAKKRQARCVHFHFFHATWMEYVAVRMAKAFRLPVVITLHDVSSLCGSHTDTLQRRILDTADKIIVHNRVSHNELTGMLQVKSDRIAIVPHGSYVGTVPRAGDALSARRKLGLPEDASVVLMFGQIKRVKGLDLLIAAMPGVIERIPKATLVVAGKAWKDDFEDYRKQAELLRLGDRFRADVRFIPDDEASDYFSAADVVALPYRKIYQSGVLLMALSYGRAVLASDILGMSEVIRHGENGFLFSSENVASLTDGLIDALSDRDRRDGIAEEGYRTAENSEWSKIGANLIDVYQSVG